MAGLSNDGDNGWIKIERKDRKRRKLQHVADTDNMSSMFGSLSVNAPTGQPPVDNAGIRRRNGPQHQNRLPSQDANTFQFTFPALTSTQAPPKFGVGRADPTRAPSDGKRSYAAMAAGHVKVAAPLPAKGARASNKKNKAKGGVGQQPAKPAFKVTASQFNQAWSQLGNATITIPAYASSTIASANKERPKNPSHPARNHTGSAPAVPSTPKAARTFAANVDEGTVYENFGDTRTTPIKRLFKQPHKCRECGMSSCVKHKWQCSIHPTQQQCEYCNFSIPIPSQPEHKLIRSTDRPDCTKPEAYPRKCQKCRNRLPPDAETHAKRVEQEKNDRSGKQRKNFKPGPGWAEFFDNRPEPLTRKRKAVDDDGEDEDQSHHIQGASGKRTRRHAA